MLSDDTGGVVSDTKGLTEGSKSPVEALEGAGEGVGSQKPSKRRGRPPKSSLAEIKEKRSVGRPKGTQAIINDYRDRMLNSPKSAKVLEAIFDAALDPENKNQAAAWKLIIDRVAPISAFDVKSGSSGTPQISINISSFGAPTVETVEDVTDVQVKGYDDTE